MSADVTSIDPTIAQRFYFDADNEQARVDDVCVLFIGFLYALADGPGRMIRRRDLNLIFDVASHAAKHNVPVLDVAEWVRREMVRLQGSARHVE
jgi:hypothetical protein